MRNIHEGCSESKNLPRQVTYNALSAVSDVIIDNRKRRVGEFLRNSIKAGSNLSVVSAYFTIYAYEAMRNVLEQSGRMRFLYGEPVAIGTPDPSEDKGKSFRLNEDGGMALNQALAQKPLAHACAAWIEKHVEIRTINRANFLHGKLYHIAQENKTTALAGSSNFTLRGLWFWPLLRRQLLSLTLRYAVARTA